MKHLLLLVAFLFLQPLQGVAQNYFVRHFNYNNGLISASNLYIYQDSTGFIWECSFGGLVRFDGIEFKSFDNSDGLSHYQVSHIFEERKNTFWICNNFKLFRFDGYHFTPVHTNLPNEISLTKMYRLSTGEIMLNTSEGCFKRSNDSTFIRFKLGGVASEEMRDLEEYDAGKLLIYKHNTQQLIHMIHGQIEDQIKLNEHEIIYSFNSIEHEPYITFRNRMCRIQNHQLKEFKPKGLSSDKFVTCIFQDRNKSLWFTDNTFNLWKLKGTELTNMTSKYHLRKITNPQFLEDKNHNLLIGYINGIYVFRESLFEEVPMPQLNSYNLYFISSFYGQDTLCYGITSKHLILISKGHLFTKPIQSNGYLTFDGDRNCSIHKTIYPNTYFLHVRKTGLYYIRNNRLEPFLKKPLDVSHLSISSLFDSAHNCYYSGASDQIFRFHDNGIDTINLSLPEKNIFPHSYQLMKDGTIYFLGTHKYLFSLKDHVIKNITNQLHLDGKEISLFSNKNHLWVLVHGIELREYQRSGDSLLLLRKISKQNGLIDANANTIKFDDDDNLWINAFTGLYFLKNHQGDSNSIYYSKKIPIHVGDNEAPLLDHLNYNHHSLYTVGEGGVLIIDTKNAVLEAAPIKTYFSSISFNGKNILELEKQGLIWYHDSTYELPYHFNTATFQLSTIYYGFDHAIQYQYKLEGQDEEWHTLLNNKVLTYNNLSSGKYILHIRSINQLNTSSFTEASCFFIIHPPYYQTWWFRLLISFIAIGFIIYLIVQRDRRKANQNKVALQLSELKLEALQSQMNPHFIFNALNSIQNYILNNDQIEAARYLSKFSKLIRKTLDNSHHQFIPLEEIVLSLTMYLELEAFRFNNEFSYSVHVDESNEKIFSIELPPMLLQPFVENAILHGLMPKTGDKKLTVDLFIRSNQLHCVIDDNGIGRMIKQKREGHVSRGQKLTEGMLESLKHLKMTRPEINFTDKTNPDGSPSGTTVSIIIPIENN